jgi:hypothetical protein
LSHADRDQNPTIDQWIAEGRLLPAVTPGTFLDLLPIPPGTADGYSLADAIVQERDREAGDEMIYLDTSVAD